MVTSYTYVDVIETQPDTTRGKPTNNLLSLTSLLPIPYPIIASPKYLLSCRLSVHSTYIHIRVELSSAVAYGTAKPNLRTLRKV